MNKLPNDIIQEIYFYKHNLEYIDVMNELLQAKINVFYDISLKQSRIMCYVKKCKIFFCFCIYTYILNKMWKFCEEMKKSKVSSK